MPKAAMNHRSLPLAIGHSHSPKGYLPSKVFANGGVFLRLDDNQAEPHCALGRPAERSIPGASLRKLSA
ncbi:hypothetical protein M514_05305 [Trichuris suis]|uniref:Uncharacterized protein n=1 Tax=Trichuris suis TaxID=68888 RepID=A0A085M9A3_9BILA|nr:hypothetical protein M513_05305 [Trichuris suis]KFD71593.1 hypothetical protein M514_05305 [Trichuris suis]